MGVGCTRSDWIDRTLITVDVTGTWQGTGVGGAPYTFNLKQEGPNVTGSIQAGFYHNVSGPVTGTVAGDVFRFAGAEQLSGEMTVSGDEMTGPLYGAGHVIQVFTLRRVK